MLKHKINKNFTVVGNEILRAKISFKAKGLFLQIISLPENWDFSIAGLAALGEDKEKSIKSGIKELVATGFLVWKRERGEDGKFIVFIETHYPQDGNINHHKAERPLDETPYGDLPQGVESHNIIKSNKELKNIINTNINIQTTAVFSFKNLPSDFFQQNPEEFEKFQKSIKTRTPGISDESITLGVEIIDGYLQNNTKKKYQNLAAVFNGWVLEKLMQRAKSRVDLAYSQKRITSSGFKREQEEIFSIQTK